MSDVMISLIQTILMFLSTLLFLKPMLIKNVINLSDNDDDADIASVQSLTSSSGSSSSLCSQGEIMTHDQPQLCDTAVYLHDS